MCDNGTSYCETRKVVREKTSATPIYIIKSNRGFSVVIVMIMIVITGLVTFNVMNMMDFATKSVSSMTARMEAASQVGLIHMMLQAQTACTATFAGVSLNAGTALPGQIHYIPNAVDGIHSADNLATESIIKGDPLSPNFMLKQMDLTYNKSSDVIFLGSDTYIKAKLNVVIAIKDIKTGLIYTPKPEEIPLRFKVNSSRTVVECANGAIVGLDPAPAGPVPRITPPPTKNCNFTWAGQPVDWPAVMTCNKVIDGKNRFISFYYHRVEDDGRVKYKSNGWGSVLFDSAGNFIKGEEKGDNSSCESLHSVQNICAAI